jgi:hypothetical protein
MSASVIQHTALIAQQALPSPRTLNLGHLERRSAGALSYASINLRSNICRSLQLEVAMLVIAIASVGDGRRSERH